MGLMMGNGRGSFNGSIDTVWRLLILFDGAMLLLILLLC